MLAPLGSSKRLKHLQAQPILSPYGRLQSPFSCIALRRKEQLSLVGLSSWEEPSFLGPIRTALSYLSEADSGKTSVALALSSETRLYSI